MSERWHLLRSGAGTAAMNMAVDETLLEAVHEMDRPVLRFYSWSERAATFGYSQRFAEAARLSELRPLIRRPTGGGVVPHARDWTYSLVFPPAHRWAKLRAVDSYREVHDWLRVAFANTGVGAGLAERSLGEKIGSCFGRAEKNDLLFGGTKVAGAAQRRNRFGLLIQGSIQPTANGAWNSCVRENWEAAMLETGSVRFQVKWLELDLAERFRQRMTTLEADKYGTERYNCSR